MFTLDAELRSERCNLNDRKTKPVIKKELEDSIANGNKNRNTDTEQKNVQRAKKVIHEFKEIIKNKRSDIA